MNHPSAQVRRAFVDAVNSFLETAALIGADQWGDVGTDRWTVLELFAHTARGMNVIGDYLDVELDPSTTATVDGASTYFRIALSIEGVHEGVAQRAVTAVEQYRDDPLSAAHEVADRIGERVASTPDDRVMKVFFETIRFSDYLVTRVVELVLHTFDLQLACGLELTAPATSLEFVDDILISLVDRAEPLALALALSGRTSSRVCNVLG
jgi:hypothetical protein